MSLQIETNIIFFPEHRPRETMGDGPMPWTAEMKQRVYHQQAEIHLINIGPVTQELLDSRLFETNFGGVTFSWNKETSEYTWTASAEGDAGASKPLPLKYLSHLLAELRKVGYHPQENYERNRPTATENLCTFQVQKQIWHLEKRF